MRTKNRAQNILLNSCRGNYLWNSLVQINDNDFHAPRMLNDRLSAVFVIYAVYNTNTCLLNNATNEVRIIAQRCELQMTPCHLWVRLPLLSKNTDVQRFVWNEWVSLIIFNVYYLTLCSFYWKFLLILRTTTRVSEKDKSKVSVYWATEACAIPLTSPVRGGFSFRHTQVKLEQPHSLCETRVWGAARQLPFRRGDLFFTREVRVSQPN